MKNWYTPLGLALAAAIIWGLWWFAGTIQPPVPPRPAPTPPTGPLIPTPLTIATPPAAGPPLTRLEEVVWDESFTGLQREAILQKAVGTVLTVTGEVVEVSPANTLPGLPSAFSAPNVMVAFGRGYVHASFPNAAPAALLAIRKGQRVTISGILDRYTLPERPNSLSPSFSSYSLRDSRLIP